MHSPAVPLQVFKGQSSVKWAFAPLDTLYDVDAIVSKWRDIGMRVRFCWNDIMSASGADVSGPTFADTYAICKRPATRRFALPACRLSSLHATLRRHAS